LAENFDDPDVARKRWFKSKAHKEEDNDVYKYDGEWEYELPQQVIFDGDRGLVLKSKAKHAAISAKLNKKFEFSVKPLFVQYEVTFQNGMDCGGGYIKLLSDSPKLDLQQFHDKTPYTIMFGPDKCGSDLKVCHLNLNVCKYTSVGFIRI
jgi:calnexin